MYILLLLPRRFRLLLSFIGSLLLWTSVLVDGFATNVRHWQNDAGSGATAAFSRMASPLGMAGSGGASSESQSAPTTNDPRCVHVALYRAKRKRKEGRNHSTSLSMLVHYSTARTKIHSFFFFSAHLRLQLAPGFLNKKTTV